LGIALTSPGRAVPMTHQFTTQPLAWKCCAKCGNAEQINRHHVLRRKDGGSDNPGNLEWLCDTCHSTWHSLRRSRDLQNELHAAQVFGRWLREVPVARRQRRLLSYESGNS